MWHEAQGAFSWPPFQNSGEPGCLKTGTLNVSGEWQVAQLVPSWPRCGSLWQVAHAVPSPFSRTAVPLPAGNVAVSFLWHFSHARDACFPESGNADFAWSNLRGRNFAPVTTWQLSQDAPTCPRCGSLWQEAHVVESPRYVLSPTGTGRPFGPDFGPPWHLSQGRLSWAPEKKSGKRGCLNSFGRKLSVPWHVAHAVPRSPLWGSSWHAAQSVLSPRKSTTFGDLWPAPEAPAAPTPFAPGPPAPGGTWHAAHFAVACLPVSGKRVFAAWSNGAPRNAFSSWQTEQSCLNWPRWGSWWQVAQLPACSFTIVAGSLWHAAQAISAWRPRSGKAVLAWSTFFVLKVAVSWHEEQSAPNAFLCGSWWQSAQLAYFTPRKTPFWWHFAQATVTCAPVSGYFVFPWSNDWRVSLNATDARWHVAQAAPSAPLWESAWQVAHEGESFRKDLVLWHDAHLPARGACLPSSGKPVSFAWSNPFASNGRSSASRPACSA